jgi:hypothetical protein
VMRFLQSLWLKLTGIISLNQQLHDFWGRPYLFLLYRFVLCSFLLEATWLWLC